MLREEIEKLVNLQKVDSEILSFKTIIEEFPVRKTEMEKSLDETSKDISFIKKEQKKIQLEKKERELELQSIEDEIKKLQKRLDEVKTNKEYTSLLSEIENLKKKKGEVEEQILVLMENEEQVNKKINDLSEKMEKTKKEVETRIAEETRKVEELKKLLEEKMKEREKIVATISGEVYNIYEKIRAGKKDGIAICKLEGQSCTGCSMFIPVYLAEKVKAKKEIVHCENCSRILY